MKDTHAVINSALFWAILSAAPMAFSTTAVQAAASGELWENTTTMDSAGNTMALGTKRDCYPINWSDAEDFKVEMEDGCQVRDKTRIKDGYRWTIKCNDRSGSGTTKLIGHDRIDTDLSMDTPEGQMDMHVISRRVGKCSNPERE